MAKVNDKHVGLARLYGRSALTLAEEAGEADAFVAELGEVARLLGGDGSFERFLTSPLVDVEVRAKSLEKIFRGKASDLLTDTLQVLNRKGRLAILPTLVEVVREEHRSMRGMIDAEVTSAVPLNEKLREKLKKVIQKRTGKEPILREEVDASLLGGIVVRVADQKFDASVKREVDTMRQVFHNRALIEIYQLRHLAITEEA